MVLIPNYATCVRVGCLFSGRNFRTRGTIFAPGGGAQRHLVVRISVLAHRFRREDQTKLINKKRPSFWNHSTLCHKFSLNSGVMTKKKKVFVAKSKSSSWCSCVFCVLGRKFTHAWGGTSSAFGVTVLALGHISRLGGTGSDSGEHGSKCSPWRWAYRSSFEFAGSFLESLVIDKMFDPSPMLLNDFCQPNIEIANNALQRDSRNCSCFVFDVLLQSIVVGLFS